MVVAGSIRSARTRALAPVAAFVCAALASLPGYAQQRDKPLADLSLEELSSIEVTSVSRRAERLVDAAASIYVVTQEDIRRSGVTSLAEALRLAPNLLVARTSASGYAISARGFNNSIGNKLLVLIDGRTVYTPLFSGVFWDSQDVMLEDVERIEVISGPGATLWGANAVNGVINVITRPAGETQGGLAYAGVGTKEDGLGLRYGGTLDSGAQYRLYDASLLIVDDHAGVRGAVRDWLAVSFPGLRVQEAPDAEQALRAVEGAWFDVVLMDVGLPGINGVEATRRLRQCAPQTKVVMVSVHDSDVQRAAAREAGAVAFVAKRCMHEGLHAALGPLLAESRAPGSAGERET